MKLSREQCVLLDSLLGAFSQNDSLSRDEILQLYEQDEKLAHSLLSVLVSTGHITEVGKTIDSNLPLIIYQEPSAILFLANGGFVSQYDTTTEKNLAQNSFQHLQKKNFELQNENLDYQKTLRSQEERIRGFEEQNKFIELLKNYWWLIAGAFALGGVIAKLI